MVFGNFKKIQFLLIIILLVLSQISTAQNLITDKIYQEIEIFVANPSEKSLQKLIFFEQQFFLDKKLKTKDEYLAVIILNCNTGYYQEQFGQTQKAIMSYEKAWRLYDKNFKNDNGKIFDISENCLQKLGNLYTKTGDYSNAENIIKQYYNLAFKNRQVALTHSAILNLSIVYQQSGRINLAIELLENMLKYNQLNSSERALYQSVLSSNYLLLNKNDKAEKAVFEAINIFEKQRNQTLKLSNCYKNLSTIYFQKKDFKLSSAYFETALRYASQTFGLGEYAQAKNFYEYAVLLHKMNDDYNSKEYLNRALYNLIDGFEHQSKELPSQQQLYADIVLLDILDFKAEIYTLEKKPLNALKAYELCNYIEDLFSNLLVHENSKIINQTRVRNRVEKCIAIYEKLFQQEKKSIYLEQAFLLSDKTKSSVLKNYLANNKTASKQELQLQNELQNINNQITTEQQKVNYADLEKLNLLIMKQNQTMILLKNSQSKNIKSVAKTLNLKQLFDKLNQDKASLLAFFVGQNIIYSFALSENKIALKKIENSAINKSKIINFIEYFASPDAITDNISSYQNDAHALYKLLQIPTKSSNENLIIIPDGLLNFVPFESLITKKTATTNFAKMNYLMNDFVIAYNNSASFYLQTNELKFNNSVLGFFPIFENTDFELSASKTEMQTIKKQFSGEYFDNEKANFDNFKTNANHFSILHLSTHADAGDLETPATIKFIDRDVLYSELYNLNINPDLVVLSACQTGIGKLYQSEGAMSIARGFQMAGAQNLLFSLWKVNDYTTAVFMEDFYKNLKNKTSFATANRDAKIDFLKNTTISNTKKSPYYWSAFVYYGSLEKPTTNYWIWILGGVVLGFGVWFLSQRFTEKKEIY